MSRKLKQPFKVKTIINILDFPSSHNGVVVREKLEQALDKLKEDGIVDKWYYTEPVDEARVGKRDWLKKYWGELNLVILPTQETIYENRKKLNHLELIKPNQNVQELLLEETTINTVDVKITSKQSAETVETPLSAESLSKIIESRKLSIRAAAAEIGIAHTSLSRYLNNTIKRYNKASMGKIKAWYESNLEGGGI